MSYDWKAGEYFYEYNNSIKTTITLHEKKLYSDINIEAVLNAKLFNITKDTIELGIHADPVFASVDGFNDPKLIYNYQIPVLIKLDRTGKFKDINYPKNTSEKQRKALLGLYSPLEMIAVPEHSYTATQKDAGGVFTAQYTISNGQLVRKKTKYDNNKTEILQSKQTLTADNWINTIDGTEHIVHRQNENTIVEAKTSLTISQIDTNNERSADFFTDTSYQQAYDKFTKGIKVYKEDHIKQKRIKLSANTTKPDITNLGQQGEHELSVSMRTYLLQNPDAIAEIPSMIMSGETSVEQDNELLKILGLISIPESQEALLDITTDPSQSENNRLGAAISFSNLQMPITQNSKDALLNRLDNIGTNGATAIDTSSVLVLGAVVHNIQTDYPLEAQELGEELVDKLGSTTPAQKKYLLKSLGNTYNNDYSEAITEHLKSDDIKVRKAAVESLSKMSDAESEEAIKELYMSEKEDIVRYSAVQSLTRRNISSDTFYQITENAHSEANMDVRRAIIALIDKNIKAHPKAEATLKKMLQTEESDVNVERIIKAAAKLKE
jgi:hypothetical protein